MIRLAFLACLALLLSGCGSRSTIPSPPTAQPSPEPLRPLPGTLSGGVWLETRGGSPLILRGVPVTLLKTKVDRPDVATLLGSLDGMAAEALAVYSAAANHEAAQEARAYRERLRVLRTDRPGEPLDTGAVYALIRSVPLAGDGTEVAKRLAFVQQDRAWPSVVGLTVVATATTGIDGKYKLGPVPPGDYFVYAAHQRTGPDEKIAAVAEWLVPVTIRPSADAQADLFNGTAALILNASDD